MDTLLNKHIKSFYKTRKYQLLIFVSINEKMKSKTSNVYINQEIVYNLRPQRSRIVDMTIFTDI